MGGFWSVKQYSNDMNWLLDQSKPDYGVRVVQVYRLQLADVSSIRNGYPSSTNINDYMQLFKETADLFDFRTNPYYPPDIVRKPYLLAALSNFQKSLAIRKAQNAKYKPGPSSASHIAMEAAVQDVVDSINNYKCYFEAQGLL